MSGLRNKVPKLSVAAGDKKILLLEKDSVPGTIESQFEQVKDSDEVRQLVRGIDEIWTTNTAGLQKENVIFTNKIWPERDRSTICSPSTFLLASSGEWTCDLTGQTASLNFPFRPTFSFSDVMASDQK